MLDAAADVLARGGLHRHAWWRGVHDGRSYRPGARVCVLGAIVVAQHHLTTGLTGEVPWWADDPSPAAVAAVRAEIGERAPGLWDALPVAVWSDRLLVARRRRAVRVLRCAAARCRRG